jgi:hypothetical protein
MSTPRGLGSLGYDFF